MSHPAAGLNLPHLLPRARHAVRCWRLWSLPPAAVAFLLLVEAAAVASTAVLGAAHPVARHEFGYFTAIVVLGVLSAEATRGVERMRRWLSDAPHVNMSSVWTLSAALLTSPALSAATAVILYAHLWARSWYRVGGVHPLRVVFNISIVVLSCHAAGAVARAMPGDFSPAPARAIDALAILLVIAAYSAVNSVLAAVALALLRDQRSLRGMVGSWHENSVEYATLCVGVLAAALLTWRPWLVVLLLLPLYVLHRSVLLRQLENAITTDERTGLLNAATWHRLAATEFERARRNDMALGLLMIDLDHFSQVNDEFGHAIGDRVLRAVADAMSEEIRASDLCGRFGGEEFVILLADTDLTRAVDVADRICGRVRALHVPGVPGLDGDGTGRRVRLSASIGAAACPDAGAALDEVLLAADNALFAAKDAGRNQAVAARLSSARPVPAADDGA
jgi:diguanylate cyclase (GGDEF)-like protein